MVRSAHFVIKKITKAHSNYHLQNIKDMKYFSFKLASQSLLTIPGQHCSYYQEAYRFYQLVLQLVCNFLNCWSMAMSESSYTCLVIHRNTLKRVKELTRLQGRTAILKLQIIKETISFLLCNEPMTRWTHMRQ